MDHKKRSLLLVLCMVLATAQACAPTLIPPPTLIPLQKEELAQLKDQPEIHAIHYARPAPKDTTRGPGGPIVPMFQFGPRGAAVGILAQLVIMGLVAAVRSATGAPEDYCWDDPVLQVKDRFLVSLEAELGLKQIRVVRDPREDDDLEKLKAEFGSSLILDFKTTNCEVKEPDQFIAYQARSRLIHLGDSKIIWQGVCGVEPGSEIPKGSSVKEAADKCAKQLLAQFIGKESPAK